MKVRLVSSIAVACCVSFPWQSLAAEEEIKFYVANPLSSTHEFTLMIK
jgi:hypothetical protein